jgi:hypothetical protein
MLLPVGAGEVRRLPNQGFRYEQVEWTPDGNSLLFLASKEGRGGAPGSYLQSIAADGGGTSPAKEAAPEKVALSRVSPDGKTAVSIRGGEIHLQELGGTAGRSLSKAMPGETAVRWASDGRGLFTAVRDSSTSLRVYRIDAGTGARSLWKELKTADPVGVTMFSVVVTPDGSSYGYSYQRDVSDLYMIKIPRFR